ncbi:sodium/solute symporter [Niabella sp. CC-SYL272]|uniref:sodium:solute symporter family transporter n=1 Tax=Niabella agricola TaxID=2891571 RepID=UPI001EEB5218|nr:sodium/solute symporter [Niabella agricola]MCF3108212.1 sodium/solute symporter [Niabella agricola]
MNITLGIADYVVLLTYIALLLAIGFYLNKRSAGAHSDIFLGGRTLRWWQIGFSLFSANAGPMMLVGFAGIGFSQGVVGSNFEWLAWIFLLLLAMCFLPHYMATRVSTMPQFLKLRFGNRAYYFLVLYSLISILLVWLGSALYAGGLIISQVFRWPLTFSVVLVTVIATSFTAVGGLKAVVRTGIFQSVIIIFSSMVLAWLALKRIGGVNAFVQALPDHYWKLFRPATDPEYSWIAIIAGYPVVAVYYWCADQTIVQKVLAARNLKEGQYGALFLAVLKIIMPLIFIFPGMMCYVLFKDTAQADNAYITLVTELMPHGLLGLCLAALIAALIDTVSSGLNSFSTVFTLDVAGRFREMDDAAKRRMGKWVTLIAGGLAIGVALLFSRSGKGFFELSQGMVSILAPPLSVVFLTGILWKRMSRLAAEVVLYGGGVICLAVGICNVLNVPYAGFWPHFLILSVYLFTGLLAVGIIISLLPTPVRDTPQLPSLLETDKRRGSDLRTVWLGWALLMVVMGAIYWLFR